MDNKVVLIRQIAYDDSLIDKIAELFEPFGGLAAFCRAGDQVFLKPNFIMARSIESAATTHPQIIIALCKLLKDHGCNVALGDSPGLGSAVGVINQLGISDQLKKLQVKVVELETNAMIALDKPFLFERRFKSLQLANELQEYDRIINLPKLKSHGQMGLTLATKNLFGCVAGPAKGQWHFTAGKDLTLFARLLLEIAFTVNASLHILDGIIGMDGNGPSNGRTRNFNLLMASTNPIALDRVVVELINERPERFPIMNEAIRLKLPGVNLAEINLVGDSIDSLRIEEFQIPALSQLNYFYNPKVTQLAEVLFKQKIILNKKRCIVCRKCEKCCPAKAISYEKQIKIDENKCIKCCCCQELCPVGALKVSQPLVMRFINIVWLKLSDWVRSCVVNRKKKKD